MNPETLYLKDGKDLDDFSFDFDGEQAIKDQLLKQQASTA